MQPKTNRIKLSTQAVAVTRRQLSRNPLRRRPEICLSRLNCDPSLDHGGVSQFSRAAFLNMALVGKPCPPISECTCPQISLCKRARLRRWRRWGGIAAALLRCSPRRCPCSRPHVHQRGPDSGAIQDRPDGDRGAARWLLLEAATAGKRAAWLPGTHPPSLHPCRSFGPHGVAPAAPLSLTCRRWRASTAAAGSACWG